MSMLRRLVPILLLLIPTAVAACSPLMPAEDVDRRDALVAAAREAAPGEALQLTASLGTHWDRVVFLGPYSSTAEMKDAYDLNFNVEAVSTWTHTEGGTIVVLADGRSPVAWMAVPTSDIGLYCVDGMSIDAAEATLVVQEDPDGLRVLRVAGDPCRYYEDVVQP